MHREIGDDLGFDEIMLTSVRDGRETQEYFGGGTRHLQWA